MGSMLPLIGVFGTGGTIASIGDETDPGEPRLSIADLAGVLPGLDNIADLYFVGFRQVPSVELTLRDVAILAKRLRTALRRGAAGFVITQGTDTLEESAYALDLLWDSDVPIVLTGAMRLANAPGADGPANLLNAVRVAVDPAARGLGTVVVFNDEIHAAQFVRKTHTSNPAAFRSPGAGPLGAVSEGVVHVWARPERRTIPGGIPSGLPQPPVALIRLAIGDDGRLLRSLVGHGFRGLVIEGLGGGHVPAKVTKPLGQLAREIPVVLASRVASGWVLASTYGFPGSETDLDRRGLINAGPLDGLKARVLLSLLLMAGIEHDGIRQVFKDLSSGSFL